MTILKYWVNILHGIYALLIVGYNHYIIRNSNFLFTGIILNNISIFLK